MIRLALFSALFLIGSIGLAAVSQTYSVKSGEIDFIATGRPSALKVTGQGSEIKGTLNLESTSVQGNVNFGLGSLDTGIDLRNHHMKEKYLEVSKYPEARLTLTKLVLPSTPLAAGFKANVPFDGTLALHGVTKPVHGTAEIVNNNGELLCDAHFSVKISDYSIDVPKYLGITIADEVQVTAHMDTGRAR